MFLNIDHSVTNSLHTHSPANIEPKNELKLVFVGNVGSGKTTSIQAISEKAMLSTEARATENDALHRKDHTTVAMEYGVVHLQDAKLHIYGTPGQRRFNFMASIVCKGAAGMVVMIDNGHSNPLNELDYFLNFHHDFLQSHPALIAVTHYDDNNTDTHLVEYHQYAKEHGFHIPVMRVDAREKEQVKQLIQKLMLEINRRKMH
ncbi:MAG: ATP/GTP-binding protein [Methylococcaceae bacterium]